MSNTSEALDCLASYSKRVHTKVLAAHLLAIMTHLSRAQIFKLPPNGIVLSSEVRPDRPIMETMDRYDVPMRLPYGEIAIEFTHTMAGDGHGEPWSRCVCIASDMREPGIFQDVVRARFLTDDCSGDGVVITSVYFHSVMRVWVPNNYAMLVKSTKCAYAIPLSEKAPNDFNRCALDLQIELQSVVMLMTALACSNVSAVSVEPSAALNKKRARSGKSPIRVHHVLVIGGDKSARKDSAAGSHASPRVHLRRGHIRRLESKNVWVNACVVGDKSRGVVTKDYRVKAVS